MKIFQHMRRGLMPALFTLMLMLIPSWAMAAGSEASVVLNFTESDKMYLYISFGLGFIALIAGFMFRAKVTKESPGNEKMQEVGLAIYEGAMAYLKQQIKTMIWFVLAIAGLLTFIYGRQYGNMTLGVLTAVSFMLGVAASYIAGYVGMDMAVKANMRTAHAALSSYAKALEVSFQAGAVAGLITVGMGLVGATAILFFLSADAMKLLIGFGFGGSLAALFMRVGGGIFTKAADVGADLVGKVEAGIPEDDARNPATIADN
ncbi:MAG: sodium/proton-translocating pyrophosphatase, partial [Fimbriimonadaceae bacterium]